MDITELKRKLEQIKKAGWVVSRGKGNTRVGYTLKLLLGIRENNLKTPDFGDIELKSQRKDASNRITMFIHSIELFGGYAKRSLWNINDLVKTFREKIPAVVVVMADTCINSEEKEEFYFNEAYFLKNQTLITL